MKKIINRLKKIFIMIGTFCLSIYTKVFAISPTNMIEEIEGVTLYGVAKPNPVKVISKIAKVYVIPVALIVGLLIYFKKSKSSKKKKLLVTLGIVAITAILYWIVSKIIYELFEYIE